MQELTQKVKEEISDSLHRIQKRMHRDGDNLNVETFENWLEEDGVWGRIDAIATKGLPEKRF